MGMQGEGFGGGPKCCVHLAIAIYAGLAVLGYWVLQRADKESGGLLKKTGGVIAWVLIVVGLLGVLCGAGSHIKGATPGKCGGNCQGEMSGSGPENEGEDEAGLAAKALAPGMMKGGAKPQCPMHKQKGKAK
jgi:hypothetical protein